MSKGYLYRSLIPVLIVMAHYNGYTESNTDLRFSIALEKNSYLVDEHIYLEMIVTNLAGDTQFILPLTTNSSWGHMKIIFKDKFGNDVESRQGETYMAPLRGWPGLKIAPGKSWVKVQELPNPLNRQASGGECAGCMRRSSSFGNPRSRSPQIRAFCGPQRPTRRPWRQA